MTKKTKLDDYRVPCPLLNRVILVKNVTEVALKKISSKLRKFVGNAKEENINLLNYAKLIIWQLLPKSESVKIVKTLSSFDLTNEGEAAAAQAILIAIYNTITEIYPQIRVENICAELNGFIKPEPVDQKEDKEFNEFLNKETKKSKSKKTGTLKEVKSIEKYLRANLIGQDHAITTVCDAIKLKLAGFTKVVTVLFLGRTGVGKTELARLLSNCYTKNFWKVDCGELSNGHEMNKFLGAPAGYIGHTGTSMIKDKAEKSNKWIILFDEIEKANHKFYNFLLPLMEEGVCHDNMGNAADFSESILIFTSNCGVADLKTNSVGWGKANKNAAATKEDLMKSLEKEFPPEFRNRFDDIVIFNDLTKEDARKIVELRLKSYPVKITTELVDYLVNNGFSEEYGARELNRVIKRKLLLKLSDTILEKETPKDGTDRFDAVVDKDEITIVNTVH